MPQRILHFENLFFQHPPYLLDCEEITEIGALFKVPQISAKGLEIVDWRSRIYGFQVASISLHLFVGIGP